MVHLSDTCVQWPDTSCSHMTLAEHTDHRSGMETHKSRLTDNTHRYNRTHQSGNICFTFRLNVEQQLKFSSSELKRKEKRPECVCYLCHLPAL